MKIIIDSNIMFSALLDKSNKFIETIYYSNNLFYSCNYTYIELFKYKEKILKNSKMSENELLEQFYILLKNISFFNEKFISKNNFEKAYSLCFDIDEKDTIFVALTLELNGLLWTGDKKLKEGLKQKGFDLFF